MRVSRANGQHQIKVSVMGGFCVEVDGQAKPEDFFERRRARDLIMLLAITPSHKLRRYQAMEALWPELDYFKGPRKLYEATGEARRRLGGYAPSFNPILSDRAQGTLAFDTAIVACDVDEFEYEARQTLAEDGDDFWVLDHARSMERLYVTGPDEHLLTMGERVVERVDELKSLYVDAMVAAGEAALRLGKVKLAVRYGSDAHRMRETREDAMMVLVQALGMAGRGYEVMPLYRRYAKLLMETEGVTPSLALRRVVAQASGDGPDVEPV